MAGTLRQIAAVVKWKQADLSVQIVAVWATLYLATHAPGMSVWVLGGAIYSNPTQAARTVNAELVALPTDSPPADFNLPQDFIDGRRNLATYRTRHNPFTWHTTSIQGEVSGRNFSCG